MLFRSNKLRFTTVIRTCHRINPRALNNISTAHVRKFHFQSILWCNKTLSDNEIKQLVETLTDKFSEARELMQDARESQGTVYFSDDIEDAQQAIKDTLEQYSNLVQKLTSEQRQKVSATLGLRMEELKAQQAALEEMLLHD